MDAGILCFHVVKFTVYRLGIVRKSKDDCMQRRNCIQCHLITFNKYEAVGKQSIPVMPPLHNEIKKFEGKYKPPTEVQVSNTCPLFTYIYYNFYFKLTRYIIRRNRCFCECINYAYYIYAAKIIKKRNVKIKRMSLKYRILNLAFKVRYFYEQSPTHSNEPFRYNFSRISIRSSNLYL